MDIKHRPLSIPEQINIINKVDSIPNVLWEKTAEKLVNTARKVTHECFDGLTQVRICYDCCKWNKYSIHTWQVLKKTMYEFPVLYCCELFSLNMSDFCTFSRIPYENFTVHTHTHFVFLTYPYNTLIFSKKIIQISQSVYSRIYIWVHSP